MKKLSFLSNIHIANQIKIRNSKKMRNLAQKIASSFYKNKYFDTQISYSTFSHHRGSTYMAVRCKLKRAKNTKNAFLTVNCPYIGQPDNQID